MTDQDSAAPRKDDPPEMQAARHRMVERQLRARDITDERVLQALNRVPRHLFVEPGQWGEAYGDWPLPIGHGQTISQPYIVALMTQLAEPRAGHRVLDIGTGCGYQAAVLAELAESVESVEIVPELAERAAQTLKDLGYQNVHVHCADGTHGWPAGAPYDSIIAAAAPAELPVELIDQLVPGGRLVIPVGRWSQQLMLIEKNAEGTTRESIIAPVAFVPMTGDAEKSGDD